MFKFDVMVGKITLQVWLTVLVFGVFYQTSQAQDPQFSQFFNAPLYLNPSFTGATNSNRVVLNHRLQWPNLPQTFATYALSWDMYRPDLRSGFGFLISTDKAGSAALRNTNVNLMYAYKIQSDTWVMTPSVYFGYGQSSIDIEKLLLGDQLEFDNGSAPTLDPEIAKLGNTNYIDFGAGFLMYTARHWIGISVYHLNSPNVSLLEAESRLPPKWSIHGGTRIPLQQGFNPQPEGAALVPYFQFKRQSTINQLDIGINYVIAPVTIGLMYRGIPLLKHESTPPAGASQQNEILNPSTDAVVFLLGLQIAAFQFAYSYDFTVSSLSSQSGGAHEISLIWEFELVAHRRVKRKIKSIPCPTFNRSGGMNPFRKN